MTDYNDNFTVDVRVRDDIYMGERGGDISVRSGYHTLSIADKIRRWEKLARNETSPKRKAEERARELASIVKH